MKRRPALPLLAQVLAWLVLHLVLLAVCFGIFVRWQLGLGLDSLLSGSAGVRLAGFGDEAMSRIVGVPRHRWNEEIASLAAEHNLKAGVVVPIGDPGFPVPVPANVMERVRQAMPPVRPEPEPVPRGPFRPRSFPRDGGPQPPPEADEPPSAAATASGADSSSVFLPKSRPSFLVRGDHGDGYWAGVLIHFPPLRNLPRRPVMLLIRADQLDGSGMFFDFKPWLWGGLAVFSLSLAVWTPFVWRITRYVRRLTNATDQISAGRFQVAIPARGNDELGELGRTIESMAARLDQFVTGQKRFLGDAAHELCAPLARIRTTVGILEHRLPEHHRPSLESLEADTGELAALVDEILVFSRTGNRPPAPREVNLEAAVRAAVAREAPHLETSVDIPGHLTVSADPGLLDRALANLVRNACVHGGPDPRLTIRAAAADGIVNLTIADSGPGVPAAELGKIFEPFYRLDRSRSRETGGNGLGLAIVRSAIQACGGEVSAAAAESGGLAVTIRLKTLGAPAV